MGALVGILEGSESILSEDGHTSKRSMEHQVSILERSEHEASMSPRSNGFAPPQEFPRSRMLMMLNKQTFSSRDMGLFTVEEVNSTTQSKDFALGSLNV